jgi:dihydroorotate dehydrogenase
MAWRSTAYRVVRPLLFRIGPEAVHHAALVGVRVAGRLPALGRLASGVADPVAAEPIELAGLRFRNRVGLAAGFDKDGVGISGWAALGFGFVELGTVTPRPQAGNPRPRLHRLPEDEALINRMGFNNAGAAALSARIARARGRLPPGLVIGVNVGRNRDGGERDFAESASAVARVADYLAINVSSPNTAGLRDLQGTDALARLIGAVREAAPGRPVLVKLAPDLDADLRSTLVRGVVAAGGAGVIVSNTSTERDGLRSSRASEAGGLSGAPLRERALQAVAEARAAAGDGVVVIGSGGVGSAADARALIDAGADLVQLWTGMIYAGPALIGEAVAAC